MSDPRRRSLGVVLSGGGSRGLAHIGVLRALGERGIRPQRMAGTSAGAIVGALYAAGYSADEMVTFFYEKSPFRLSKVSLTKPGVIDIDKVVADFEEYFPDNSFEALDVDLSVVTTDLLNGERVVFESGELILPVLASSSVPVVFTPTVIEERLFADGGIVDNFPVDLVAGSCDVVLGVFVNPLREVESDDLSSSFAIFQRALEVGAYWTSKRKFDRCDFLVFPERAGKYWTFETKHLEEIEQIGYEAALEQIDAIEQALQH